MKPRAKGLPTSWRGREWERYITVVLKDRKEAKFEIINSVGKVIDVIDVNGSTNVNTKGYAAGIYFLRDKSGKLATKKFSIVK